MSFVEMLEGAKVWATGNLPIVVGGFVALLVLTFLVVIAARRRGALDPAKLAPASANALTGEKALSWAPPEQSYADRRGAVRREGQPVRVLLASNTFRNGAGDGYVIDRSTGGLKLATQSAVPPGTTVQVRAVDAPDTIGFVTVIVRSCRKNTNYYELGCEFEKTPPWNVLLLFG
ncbi:PilZ domain-containing protein [Gemmata sp. G18]|uniref:PilZ domain-containing protein n=1 Tax=Gemmata palustris TaxID=2822762 RepID=A0ABS5C044_9BACT|nr:PilZ domain-containing protein [Gemmata palustris]MBP3959349.1 PilZ domain-containing protein [Gemmata palustris]